MRPRRVCLECMNALPLTIFVSLALAVFFIGMFVLQVCEGGGNPRDALLPLEEDGSEASPKRRAGRGD